MAVTGQRWSTHGGPRKWGLQRYSAVVTTPWPVQVEEHDGRHGQDGFSPVISAL
jgi:hypothetical protein